MGLWSYSQLTSLHLAFIKLPLSKFVAPESRGCLLPKAKFTDRLIQRSRHPFATAQRTNGAAVPLSIHSLPNIVTGVPKIPVKARDVVTTHSNIHSDGHATISHQQKLLRFSCWTAPVVNCDTKAATKNMSSHVIGTKDGVLSENVPHGAVDDDELTRVSI